MRVDQLTLPQLREALEGDGLRIATGPFHCCLRSDLGEIVAEIAQSYAHHRLLGPDDFMDFHVDVTAGRGLRRWIRPQALFTVDGVEPFTPLPRDQAVAMIEWGLNWCITAYSNHVLILHAAAVARNGHTLILPAPPGSGKSTLCAALVNRGWRLLSDELAIIRLDTGAMLGMARPVNLKNASIDVIQRFAPQARFTAPVYDTTKGTVALMAAPQASVEAVDEPAWPAWMVLPRYRAGAATRLTPMPRGEAFMKIADNAMNYHILAAEGFRAVGELVDRCQHFSFEYSDLEEAMQVFDQLAASTAGRADAPGA